MPRFLSSWTTSCHSCKTKLASSNASVPSIISLDQGSTYAATSVSASQGRQRSPPTTDNAPSMRPSDSPVASLNTNKPLPVLTISILPKRYLYPLIQFLRRRKSSLRTGQLCTTRKSSKPLSPTWRRSSGTTIQFFVSRRTKTRCRTHGRKKISWGSESIGSGLFVFSNA